MKNKKILLIVVALFAIVFGCSEIKATELTCYYSSRPYEGVTISKTVATLDGNLYAIANSSSYDVKFIFDSIKKEVTNKATMEYNGNSYKDVVVRTWNKDFEECPELITFNSNFNLDESKVVAEFPSVSQLSRCPYNKSQDNGIFVKSDNPNSGEYYVIVELHRYKNPNIMYFAKLKTDTGELLKIKSITNGKELKSALFYEQCPDTIKYDADMNLTISSPSPGYNDYIENDPGEEIKCEYGDISLVNYSFTNALDNYYKIFYNDKEVFDDFDVEFDFNPTSKNECPKNIYFDTFEKKVYSSKNKINKVSCGYDEGKVTKIPKKIPELTSYAFTIIQVAVPVILILMGAIDLFKGITSQKEDEIKKGQQILIKRLIIAVLIFLIIVLVKFIISLVAGAGTSNIIDCVDCFLNNSCYDGRIDLK